VFSIADFSQEEGNSGTKLFTVTVTRDGETGGTNTVTWTATPSGDFPVDGDDFVSFQPQTGTLTFEAEETAKDITFAVLGDTDPEDPLVKDIAAGPSYGLPVGGPAARLLSELLLNRVDRLLVGQKIQFRRFVDDYVIFANSREEAQSALIRLTQFLLTNEGLSLQKAKTRIMSSSEFLATSDLAEAPEGETPEDAKARTFRRLRIHYDPYSPTREEDYEALVAELNRFDIVGMLGRELAKSPIDEGLTRRLVAAVRHLPVAT